MDGGMIARIRRAVGVTDNEADVEVVTTDTDDGEDENDKPAGSGGAVRAREGDDDRASPAKKTKRE